MRLLSVASVAPSNQKYDGSFGRMVHWKWGYPVIRTHLSTHFYKHRYICR